MTDDDKQAERETLMAARLDAARARHAEPVPAAVAVGQWPDVGTFWKEPPWLKEVRRVELVDVALGCVDHRSIDGVNVSRALGSWEPWVCASPKDALDAKLATLTPEQRARVAVVPRHVDRMGPYVDVVVDGERVACETADWYKRTHRLTTLDDPLGEQIDRMLAAIDRALAKPATQTRPDVGTTQNARLRSQLAAVTAERDEARRVADAANCVGPWRWQGDGGDDLKSMSDGMVVTMTAGDLRSLIGHRLSLALDEVTKLRRQHAELGGAIERLTELLGGEVARGE